MKNKILQFIKYWGQLFLFPIYWLSFLTSRDNNIWLFGSTFGRRFADNPRYLYTYIIQKHKDIRPIWITHNKSIAKMLRSKGLEAYYCFSLIGLWFSLKGKVYIFDNYSKDINFWTSGGAIKVNLWHGVGNKRINYDNIHDSVRHPENIWEKLRYFPRRITDEKPSHYILATSPVMSHIFARAFRVDKSRVIKAGYPRNDVLFKEWEVQPFYTKEEKKLIQFLNRKKKSGKKILGYIPTFRKSEKQFMNIMDLSLFNNFLDKNNMFLVCKLHPKSLLKKEFQKIKFSNICNVNADIDINSFLRKIDILITDYSSVYSDFMLLDRPVVAFQYDLDEYIQNTRDTYFSFEQYMPELKAETMHELMEALTIVSDRDINSKKRQCSRQVMFSKCDSNSCKEITEKIIRLL